MRTKSSPRAQGPQGHRTFVSLFMFSVGHQEPASVRDCVGVAEGMQTSCLPEGVLPGDRVDRESLTNSLN